MRVDAVSTLLLPLLALLSLSVGADEYDSYSTEQGHQIGWKKMLSCDEGDYNTLVWEESFGSLNLDSAITLQFLPSDSTPSDFDFTNDASDEFAVMIAMCANPMIAVNLGLTPSWTYNLNTMQPAGQTDLENWLGSSAAKARLSNTCTKEASSFEDVQYWACGNHGGIHIMSHESSGYCVWDWQDDLADVESLSVWLGYMPQQNAYCEVVEGESVLTIVDPCDDAQCEDPFICDADADQFATVSDAQYPCKRDCDLFGIDEYLDQCSAVFPAAIETVTASISRVNESVLQITSVDIPAVTARVQLNEDAVTTINTELGSVETLIAALNDVDAATDSRVTLNEDAVTAMNSELSSVETSIEALNEVDTATDSRIVAVMALAESNEETAGSLEERLTFLERRIAGFEASDVSAAKSADGQLDVGGELFGSTAQLPYKDELIGALVATNLITMAGFVCFAMTKRCNAKHKYVSVMDDEESDREKLNI